MIIKLLATYFTENGEAQVQINLLSPPRPRSFFFRWLYEYWRKICFVLIVSHRPVRMESGKLVVDDD